MRFPQLEVSIGALPATLRLTEFSVLPAYVVSFPAEYVLALSECFSKCQPKELPSRLTIGSQGFVHQPFIFAR